MKYNCTFLFLRPMFSLFLYAPNYILKIISGSFSVCQLFETAVIPESSSPFWISAPDPKLAMVCCLKLSSNTPRITFVWDWVVLEMFEIAEQKTTFISSADLCKDYLHENCHPCTWVHNNFSLIWLKFGKICHFLFGLDQRTLILKLSLDMVKMYTENENEIPSFRSSQFSRRSQIVD